MFTNEKKKYLICIKLSKFSLILTNKKSFVDDGDDDKIIFRSNKRNQDTKNNNKY